MLNGYAEYKVENDNRNKFRIEAVKNKISTWLNGKPVVNLDDDMTPIGFIGLQDYDPMPPWWLYPILTVSVLIVEDFNAIILYHKTVINSNKYHLFLGR